MDYEPFKVNYSSFGIEPISISVYPDNMPIAGRCKHGSHISSVLVRPNSMTDFVAAMFWIDAWVWRGGNVPNLVLPFVPGARQDRMNHEGDFLFTAKSVANMINARNFPKVIVVDPHSEVVSALINNCEVVPSNMVADLLKKEDYAAVVSPDAGAEKRATSFAKNLGKPVIHAWKTRNVADGSISGFGHEPIAPSIKGKLLIVDDICDGGGTFLGLEKELRKAGYKADLFVTHGIFSKGTKSLTKVFENVFTTDSIARRQENVKVIEICEKLMRGIY